MRRFLMAAAGLMIGLSLVGAVAAQIGNRKDPLAPGSQAATGCSTTDASSCAQAATKILPIVMGPSPLEDNLRRLTDEVGGRVSGTPQMAKAAEWAMAAFRAAGIDAHSEKYKLPSTWAGGKSIVVITTPVAAAHAEPPAGVAPVERGGLPLRAVSEAWGPATPSGGLEGP